MNHCQHYNVSVRRSLKNRCALLCHFDTDLLDSSGYGRELRHNLGPVILDNQHAIFGSGSAYASNTGNNGLFYDASEIDLSGAFTMECWMTASDKTTVDALSFGIADRENLPDSITATRIGIYLRMTTVYPPAGIQLLRESNNSSNAQIQLLLELAQVTSNEWYHCAVTRDDGGHLRAFINGQKKWEGVDTNDFTRTYASMYTWRGQTRSQSHTDEIRILSGIAVWTDNFTPPTAPYTGKEFL